MKKLQYGILLVILPLVLAFSYYMTFSATKPLSLVEDINQSNVSALLSTENNSVAFKGYFYFMSYVPETGYEVWRSDSSGNTTLAVETVSGPENAGIKKAFTDENYLYIIVGGTGENNSDVIYYLSEPTEEFKTLDLGQMYDQYQIKEIDGKWYGQANGIASNDENIIIFDGMNTSIIDVEEDNPDQQYTYYYLQDFTVFNGEVHYLIKNTNTGLLELRKVANSSIEILHTISTESFHKLYQTDGDIYFSTRDADYNINLYQFDGTSTTYVDNFESIYENWGSYGDNLVLFAQKDDLSEFQIWLADGAGLQQVSNISGEDYVTITRMTPAEVGLYYLYRNQNGWTVKYLKDGLIQTVDLETSDINNYNSQEPLVTHNGSMYLSGRFTEDGSTRSGYWKITDGIATRVFSTQGYLGNSKMFRLNEALYTFVANLTQSDLLRLDDPSGVASLVSTFDINNLIHLAADDLTDSIFAKSSTAMGAEVFAINSQVANKLVINGATGSSNPKQFVGVKDKTYFIAADSIVKTVWQSDGYTTEKVPDLDIDGIAVPIEKIEKWGDKLIIIGRNIGEANYKLWSYDGSETTLLDEEIQRVYDIVTHDGGNAYFSGSYDSYSPDALMKITTDGVTKIFDNGQIVNRLTQNQNNIFFQTGSRANAELWKVSDDSVLKLSQDEGSLHEYHNSEFYSENEHTYFQGCEGDFNLIITSYSSSNGVDEVDTSALSGIDCDDFQAYDLGDEIVIISNPYEQAQKKIWRLNDGIIEQVPGSYYMLSTKRWAHNGRLYFSAQSSQEDNYLLYVYQNGEILNTFLGGRYNIWLGTAEKSLGRDWIIYPGGSGSLEIYEFDGSNVTLLNTISNKYHEIYSVTELSEYTLLQVMNRNSQSYDLIALDQSGELTYLNTAQEFNYGRYGGNEDYPISRGHGKWLFMQACHYTIGCEPFSMNINKPPVAKVSISDTSVYSGYSVGLDATHSEDPDGNIIEYLWTVISGPEIEITEDGFGEASFVAPMVDATTVVEIKLEIIDDGYDKDTKSKQVTILPNTSPVAVLDAPSEADSGSVVKLDATQSSDPENDQLSYNWEIISDLDISLSNTNGPESEFSVPSISEDTAISVKLIVTDIVGNSAEDVVEIALKAADSGNPDDGSGDDGPNNSGSGGGGSANGLLLFMLVSFILLRFGYYRR